MKLFAFLTLLVFTGQAQAVFDLDASQSSAAFTLGDVLHTVHGTFKVKRGSIRFDLSTGSASGEIIVDATSGESGSGARDKRMHRNVLESQQFPEISFAPTRVRGTVSQTGESKVDIDGTFVVPYVLWGMKNPSTLFLKVDETVAIDLDATGHITWPH
jgi:polyisoprenoid-binding protein YceI